MEGGTVMNIMPVRSVLADVMRTLEKRGFKLELEGLGNDPEVKILVYRRKNRLFQKLFIGKVAEITISGPPGEEKSVEILSRHGEGQLDNCVTGVMLRYRSINPVPFGFADL